MCWKVRTSWLLALVVAHGSKFKGPCLVILYGTGTRVIDGLWLLNNIKNRTPNRADGTLVKSNRRWFYKNQVPEALYSGLEITRFNSQW